jgi:two-component system sensor histidine kinase PilS (NtrC family)
MSSEAQPIPPADHPAPTRWRMLARWFPSARIRPPDAYWRSLQYFNLYRIVLAIVLIVVFLTLGTLTYGIQDPYLFYSACVAYIFIASAFTIGIHVRWPPFVPQLSLHILADVAFILVLMHASGGVRSGLALLLLISLAATGMIGRGKLALLHAAVASLGVLGETAYRHLYDPSFEAEYFTAALTSLGYFATAALAHTLTHRLYASEQVLQEQSVDLANLAQVNQLVIKDMEDGVLVVDGHGRVRQHNVQTLRLIGLPRLVGDEMRVADFSPLLLKQYESWKAGSALHGEVLWSADRARMLRANFLPIGSDRSHGAVIFLQDLSKLQAQTRQLKLAALGRLTANIAHEIRNPLSSISYATELLREEPARNETEKRLLQIIQDNTYRLERMVQEVLQLNRRDRTHPESIDPSGFAAEFIEEFIHAEKLPAGAIALAVEAGAALCFDKAHLHQVLWNLCRNAWRYGSKQPGSVRMRVFKTGEGNIIAWDVSDDGPGVDEATRSKLFEPFFTTSSQGTGLGLYIARELCDANGAGLDQVESSQGACFRMTCRGAPC